MNRPILVGVSGGPDSLCLMLALSWLNFPLIVAHFDHQLRLDSKEDASVVGAYAVQLGYPFVLGSQDVTAFANHQHLSIEDAARTLRYRFLFEQARVRQAQAVAVGHTADDQVETILMHLIRGAGINGLTGMPYRTMIEAWDAEIPLVRPLLSFWREETVACCREANFTPVIDASNQDTKFLRNRIRHDLIPTLETYNPKVRQALWRTTQLLAGEEEIVREAIENTWTACQPVIFEHEVRLALAALRKLSPGLRRGVLRKAASQLLPEMRDVDFAAIQRAEKMVMYPSAGQVDFGQGLRLFVEQDQLIISTPGQPAHSISWPLIENSEEQSLTIPGTIHLGSGWQLSTQWVEKDDLLDQIQSAPPTAWEAWLDASMLPDSIQLRKPRPGDRFQPLGMSGHSIKLSDFWINRKHPRRFRAGWPLLAAGENIIWVPGFQLANQYRVQSKTRKALYIRLDRVSESNIKVTSQ